MESYGETGGSKESGGCSENRSWAGVYYVKGVCLVCHWWVRCFLGGIGLVEGQRRRPGLWLQRFLGL